MRPGATRFATNYIALDSLLKKRVDLKKIFISNEWASHKLSRTEVGHEAIYTVLRIFASEVVPTMPFVYELIRLMKTNLDRLKAKEWVKHIIADRWNRTLKHPLHAAGN